MSEFKASSWSRPSTTPSSSASRAPWSGASWAIRCAKILRSALRRAWICATRCTDSCSRAWPRARAACSAASCRLVAAPSTRPASWWMCGPACPPTKRSCSDRWPRYPRARRGGRHPHRQRQQLRAGRRGLHARQRARPAHRGARARGGLLLRQRIGTLGSAPAVRRHQAERLRARARGARHPRVREHQDRVRGLTCTKERGLADESCARHTARSGHTSKIPDQGAPEARRAGSAT
jgi:hypothetical protein